MSKKHSKQHHEEHIDETWLIPYADLLTLLLALFIILFASSQLDSKKYDNIMRALNSAFSGGTSFFDQPTTVPPVMDPTAAKKDQPEKNEQNQQQQQQSQQQAQQQNQLNQDQLKQMQQAERERMELEELKKKLDQYIQDNALNTQLDTKLTNDLLMITIRDNALYASGSATVKPEAQKLASAISDMLVQYPNYQIEVAGHTDNLPIKNAEFDSNWDLSAKRALNFMKILLANSKIDPARFRSIGYGEYRPIDTNDTAEGRAKNRRVEVSILRSIKPPEVKSVNPQ